MIIDVVTIFPAMVEAALVEGVVGRARTRGVVDIRAWDLREFTDDRHRTVDDVPYGGGPGMVMKPEPIVARGGGDCRRARHHVGGGADDAAGTAIHPRGRGAAEPAGTACRDLRAVRRGRRARDRGAGAPTRSRSATTCCRAANCRRWWWSTRSRGWCPASSAIAASVEADSFVRGLPGSSALHAAGGVSRPGGAGRALVGPSCGDRAVAAAGSGCGGRCDRRPELIDAASLSGDERHEWEAFLKEKSES